jgi:hypothetical protein
VNERDGQIEILKSKLSQAETRLGKISEKFKKIIFFLKSKLSEAETRLGQNSEKYST